MNKVEKLPLWKQWIFALGQMGWSLVSYSVANLIAYFYLPPEGRGSIFPTFIYQGFIFGSFTIIGLINAFSRIFDAVTDPLVAGMSDRSRFKLGRRRTFLLISFVPFVITSLLVFFPPVQGESIINAVWLTIIILLFYWFMTLFCTPYNAWISELGHTPEERLNLSTWISITWALGFALGNTIYLVQGIFENLGYSSVISFQIALCIYGVISLLLMALPIIFIDENRYCERHVSTEKPFEAVLSAFKNKNFFVFTLSDFAYWVALTFIQTGIAYYTTVLLQLDKSNATTFMTVMFLLSFLFYIPINLIAKRIGKKLMLSIAFVLFSLVFVLVFFLGRIPLAPFWQGIALVTMASLPMAMFGILPNAIVADIADADGKLKGNYKAAVFFGARTFMMKMGIAFTNLLFPSIVNLGRSIENDTGIRLTGVIAFVFCLIGLVFFLLYREDEILAIIRQPEKRNEKA
jgi:Na+/melibiose symporter-like transporter